MRERKREIEKERQIDRDKIIKNDTAIDCIATFIYIYIYQSYPSSPSPHHIISQCIDYHSQTLYIQFPSNQSCLHMLKSSTCTCVVQATPFVARSLRPWLITQPTHTHHVSDQNACSLPSGTIKYLSTRCHKCQSLAAQFVQLGTKLSVVQLSQLAGFTSLSRTVSVQFPSD